MHQKLAKHRKAVSDKRKVIGKVPEAEKKGPESARASIDRSKPSAEAPIRSLTSSQATDSKADASDLDSLFAKVKGSKHGLDKKRIQVECYSSRTKISRLDFLFDFAPLSTQTLFRRSDSSVIKLCLNFDLL